MVNKLTAAALRKLLPNKKISDGGGLYVFTDHKGAGSWRFLFTFKGKRCRMSLGRLRDVTLVEARDLASDARRLVRGGTNPILARKEEKIVIPTFGKVSDELLASKASEWRSNIHQKQWERSLNVHASALRSMPVNQVDTAHILSVLKPIWREMPETATRLRQRIEAVLNAAKAQGYRSGENPAAWRGHLSHLLPKKQRVAQKHYAAMDYRLLPDFMTRLRQEETSASYALQFTIFTAARSGEVYWATWEEINFDEEIWTIPAERMKSGRAHRVPLSTACSKILNLMPRLNSNSYLFPGIGQGKPLSHVAMAKVLARLGESGVTPHGFRSSFRDWCGNETSYPREVAEAALAHVVGDAAEQAYRRSDALSKRRSLMEDWATYCLSAETLA